MCKCENVQMAFGHRLPNVLSCIWLKRFSFAHFHIFLMFAFMNEKDWWQFFIRGPSPRLSFFIFLNLGIWKEMNRTERKAKSKIDSSEISEISDLFLIDATNTTFYNRPSPYNKPTRRAPGTYNKSRACCRENRVCTRFIVQQSPQHARCVEDECLHE